MLYLPFIILVILLFLCYSVIPTVLIRLIEWGIIKKTKANSLVLTFDDGPNPTYTLQLLDLLKKYGVKASFFVVGSKVRKSPEIIKRMYQEGHTIGIHHFHHVSSWIISPSQLKKELMLTEKAIKECTNHPVTFYRPPWGHFNLFSLLISKSYKVVMWSAIFGDWKIARCKNGLLKQLMDTTEPGSILLLHDCGDTFGADKEAPQHMLKTLDIFLQEHHKRGTRFITLNELNS